MDRRRHLLVSGAILVALLVLILLLALMESPEPGLAVPGPSAGAEAVTPRTRRRPHSQGDAAPRQSAAVASAAPAEAEPRGDPPPKGRITGKVVDRDGRPRPNLHAQCIHLTLLDLGDLPGFGPQRSERQDWWGKARTGTDGTFTFADLQMGKFKVRVFDAHDAFDRTVVLTPECPFASIEIPCPATGTIRGEVTDVAGLPLPDVTVDVYFGRVLDAPSDAQCREIDVVRTDPGGRWIMENVPSGSRIRILFMKDGYEILRVFEPPFGEGQTRSVFTVLHRSAVVRGTIRLDESVVGKERAKEILAGALVEIAAFTFEESGETTLARGPFRTRAAPDGSYRAEFKEFLVDTILFVRAPGFRPKLVSLHLKKGEERTHDMTLDERGGVISGRIELAPGQVCPETTITFLPTDETKGLFDPLVIRANPDGTFLADCLDFASHFLNFQFGEGPARKSLALECTPDTLDLVVRIPD